MKCLVKKGFFFVRECGAETNTTCAGCRIPVCKRHLNGNVCKECSRKGRTYDDHYDHHQNDHHHNDDYNRQDEDEFAAAAAASEIISSDSDDADFFDS